MVSDRPIRNGEHKYYFMKFKYSYLFILFLLSVGMYSCNKQNPTLTEGGLVRFSTDTVFFDTVFTALKSSTRIVRVYNEEQSPIKVNVNLLNGENTSFKINVDGRTGYKAENIEILANDSATIFINAMIDETSEDTAFVIQDELVVELNGRDFQIPIIAFAQNAHYLYDSVLTTTTFTNDRPYVIIKGALVSEGHTLTVEPGTKIYMHQNSRLFVLGSLKVQGTLEEPVYMQSDRIDRDIYIGSDKDMPGEWGGIYFFDVSHNNSIEYAIIKNGGLPTEIAGSTTLPALIQVDKDLINGPIPKLTLKNTVIKNANQYGLLSFGGSIYAENCVFANSQKISIALLEGGKYTFNDCTIGIFGGLPYFGRSTESASMLIQNFYESSPGVVVGRPLDLKMNNCIISGNFENEFIVNNRPEFSSDVQLNYCLIRQKEAIPSGVIMNNCIFNIDPLFKNISESDFHPNDGSPLIGAGTNSGEINTDLDGIDRESPPTIGAYEYVPGE